MTVPRIDDQNNSDWISRVTVPDMYPRKEDPFRPPAMAPPLTAPPASMVSADQLIQADIYSGWVSSMGQRPVVYQRALNFEMTAGVTPLPLLNQQFQTDGILVNVDSTAANSIFFGYGSGITITSGVEIRAGLPQFFSPDNTRELWEIQRVLEQIAAMIAAERGYNSLGQFRTPRVVMNANEYFVVAAAATSIRIMLFTVPEMQ